VACKRDFRAQDKTETKTSPQLRLRRNRDVTKMCIETETTSMSSSTCVVVQLCVVLVQLAVEHWQCVGSGDVMVCWPCHVHRKDLYA